MTPSAPLPFTKLEGTGNDFVLLDFRTGGANAAERESLYEDGSQLRKTAIALADRRFGVGADQIILLADAPEATAVRFLNADGSEAELCGNGLRAVGVYLAETDNAAGRAVPVTYAVVTPAGNQVLTKTKSGWSVRMGVPVVAPELEKGSIAGVGDYSFHRVSMGNPHAVLYGDRTLTAAELAREGAALEHHPLFPARTNVEFVRVIDRDRVQVQVWERGAGATLSCGTGACAVVAAGIKQGRLNRRVEVELPGGVLEIAWPTDDAPIELGGPARLVFRGQFYR